MKSSKKIWLWIIGWIVAFPIPLTILMLRKKKLGWVIKLPVIAVAWLFYIAIVAAGNSSDEPGDGNLKADIGIESEVDTSKLTGSAAAALVDSVSGLNEKTSVEKADTVVVEDSISETAREVADELETASSSKTASDQVVAETEKKEDFISKETEPDKQETEVSHEPVFTFVEMSEIRYPSQNMNVRSTPELSGDVVGSLTKNQEVVVTGRCNETGWYRIKIGNTEGYARDDFLKDEKTVEKVQETTGNTETGNSGSSNLSNYTNDPVPQGPSYIGNVTNMKLHSVKCKGNLPKEKNRVYFNTLDEAVAAGYLKDNQCKNCKPFNK